MVVRRQDTFSRSLRYQKTPDFGRPTAPVTTPAGATSDGLRVCRSGHRPGVQGDDIETLSLEHMTEVVASTYRAIVGF